MKILWYLFFRWDKNNKFYYLDYGCQRNFKKPVLDVGTRNYIYIFTFLMCKSYYNSGIACFSGDKFCIEFNVAENAHLNISREHKIHPKSTTFIGKLKIDVSSGSN